MIMDIVHGPAYVLCYRHSVAWLMTGF